MLPVPVARLPVHGEVVSGWVTYCSNLEAPQMLMWNMHQAFEIEAVLHGHHERHHEGLVRVPEAGDASLVPAWEPHGYRSLTSDTVLLVVFFLPEFLGDEVLGDVSWLSLFVAAPDERPSVTSADMRSRVLAITAELRREIEAGGEQAPGYITAMRLGVLQLLFTLSRRWKPPKSVGMRSRARPSRSADVSLVPSPAGAA